MRTHLSRTPVARRPYRVDSGPSVGISCETWLRRIKRIFSQMTSNVTLPLYRTGNRPINHWQLGCGRVG